MPRLRKLQIEHSGNQNRAANVRSDQPHAMTRFVIDEAVGARAEDPNMATLVAACRERR